jgi:hypothetical protein
MPKTLLLLINCLMLLLEPTKSAAGEMRILSFGSGDFCEQVSLDCDTRCTLERNWHGYTKGWTWQKCIHVCYADRRYCAVKNPGESDADYE